METKKNINHKTDYTTAILKEAKQAFEETTGCNIQTLKLRPRGEKQPDAVIQIKTPEGTTKKYHALVKAAITKATLGYAAEQIRILKKPAILVTRQVTQQIAERLKAMDIAFIDNAGNAYINDPPIFIYITGNKKKNETQKNITGRAFRPTGLKVVFALLCQPKLVEAPYREIVRATHVAQGTVGWVMNDLKQQNYLAERGKHGRKLINVKKLFDVWIETYARELRPKLYIGTYQTKKTDWWKNINWRETDALLGAEPAAVALTNYLKPATITIYGPKEVDQFLLTHRLTKDPTGNVEMFQRFWGFDYQWDYDNIVPPILVYADLIATGNDRNIEAARMIYEKFIHRFIEKL